MRGWWMVSGLVLILLLTACGGKDSGQGDRLAGQQESRPAQSGTPRVPAPRSRPLPSADPGAFEAPFNVGDYVRQSLQGQPIGTQSGGQQAVYQKDQTHAVLTIYYFDQPQDAVETVRFALGGASITRSDATPFYDADIAYGIAQDTRGSYLAAWSHGGWCFLVQTTGDRAALDRFLKDFPY